MADSSLCFLWWPCSCSPTPKGPLQRDAGAPVPKTIRMSHLQVILLQRPDPPRSFVPEACDCGTADREHHFTSFGRRASRRPPIRPHYRFRLTVPGLGVPYCRPAEPTGLSTQSGPTDSALVRIPITDHPESCPLGSGVRRETHIP